MTIWNVRVSYGVLLGAIVSWLLFVVLWLSRIKEIGDKSVTFLHEISRESDKIILVKAECVRAVMSLESKKLINVKEFFTSFV